MTHPAHRLQNCLQNRPIRRTASSRVLPIVVAATAFLIGSNPANPGAAPGDSH